MHADEQFEYFVNSYPASRRQRGYMATTLFLAALDKVPFSALLAALEQHKRSAQWETPRHIPLMTTWLEQERWIQVLPEPGEATGAMSKVTEAAMRAIREAQ